MAGTATPDSTVERPLPLRLRQELSVRRHRYLGRPFWVVKEPLGQRYFRFQEGEYAILQMLDGRVSLREIKRRFEDEFAPRQLRIEELHRFIGMLHRGGLVSSDAPGQGLQLLRRGEKRRWQERLSALTNVLALRMRGIDPDRILNRLLPIFGWIFSPAMIVVTSLLALAAMTLVATHFGEFRARLPAFHEFFAPQHWLLLGVVLAVTKILHEFGHGLSCKRLGGECHEMGFMLLVLTPCLYCNVSDSWLLPNKWHRMAIGAGGMYVELLLASLATFLWWFSRPGMLNHVCLQVMFLCSVSTVLFNANPLLRYDGYYILSDWIEIPNLRQKASEILRRFLLQNWLGIELNESPFLPQRRRFFFGLFTVAAVTYRWFILFSILWFLQQVFEPYGLQVIGQLIALVAVGGLFIVPLVQFSKYMYVPGRWQQVKWPRFTLVSLAAAAVLAAVLLVPLPHRVAAPVMLRPQGAATVYAETAGILVEQAARPGDWIGQGELLARLEDPQLTIMRTRLEANRNELVARQAVLERLSYDVPGTGGELEILAEQIAALEAELETAAALEERLRILAPCSGLVVPPPPRNEPPPEGSIREWQGLLLDPVNLGAFVQTTDIFCQVAPAGDFEAQLAVSMTDGRLIEPGQSVRIQLEAYPGEVIEGSVSQVALGETSRQRPAEAGRQGKAGGASQPNAQDYESHFLVMTTLDKSQADWQAGIRGEAKVFVGYTPLAVRFWRYLEHTFSFEL